MAHKTADVEPALKPRSLPRIKSNRSTDIAVFAGQRMARWRATESGFRETPEL